MRKYRKRKVGGTPLRLDNTPRPRFKGLRDEKGSQRFVGDQVGLSDFAVRQTENGETTPSLLTAFKYAIFLGAPLDELFPDVIESARQELREISNATISN